MGLKQRIILVMLSLFGLVYAADRTLYILHTNNTNSALENCYCPDHPYGAIEKRAAYIENWLTEHPNTIIVDSGDLISLIKRAIKDSLASLAYSTIPYDAILPGDQELIRGQEYLIELLKRTAAPIVNTNIRVPKIKNSRPVRIIERDGIRVAILGVVGPAAIKYYPEAVRTTIALEDVNTALSKHLKGLETKADIIVLLTHQGYDYDVKLAANLIGVDVIIGAHSQTSLKTAQEINAILVAQAGKEGYYIGIIEVKLDEAKQISSKSGYLVPMTLDLPDHPRVMELIKEYEQKTGIVNRRKRK